MRHSNGGETFVEQDENSLSESQKIIFIIIIIIGLNFVNRVDGLYKIVNWKSRHGTYKRAINDSGPIEMVPVNILKKLQDNFGFAFLN